MHGFIIRKETAEPESRIKFELHFAFNHTAALIYTPELDFINKTLSTSLLSAPQKKWVADTLKLQPKLAFLDKEISFAEVTMLHSFDRMDYAIYFAISLAFFKLKYTLIKFQYRNVTVERQHVMQRYFPNQTSPRNFPDDKDAIARIENKVLSMVQFSRFRKSTAVKILSTLQSNASSYPRQRQLCKAMLNQLIKEKVAVPSFTTLQDCVSQIWNDEQARILKAYYRYTTQAQRECIISLLDKTDDHHRIVSIKKDMKEFNTENIHEELEKHTLLKAVFIIANNVLPKLQLPDATINYYADLINYYNGTRLKQLNSDSAALYLLCYSYSRFQSLNDIFPMEMKMQILKRLNF